MAGPNLDDMKLFAAVVHAGGFRPAAQQFGLPASSVSDEARWLTAQRLKAIGGYNIGRTRAQMTLAPRRSIVFAYRRPEDVQWR